MMLDDALIALGRSAYASMNRETTYGGYLESSYKRIVINVMSGATDAQQLIDLSTWGRHWRQQWAPPRLAAPDRVAPLTRPALLHAVANARCEALDLSIRGAGRP